MPERILGTVKTWMQGKGIGFITPKDGGQDLFCPHSAVKAERGEYIALTEGQECEYSMDPVQSGKCNKVIDVTAPGGDYLKLAPRRDRSRSRGDRRGPPPRRNDSRDRRGRNDSNDRRNDNYDRRGPPPRRDDDRGRPPLQREDYNRDRRDSPPRRRYDSRERDRREPQRRDDDRREPPPRRRDESRDRRDTQGRGDRPRSRSRSLPTRDLAIQKARRSAEDAEDRLKEAKSVEKAAKDDLDKEQERIDRKMEDAEEDEQDDLENQIESNRKRSVVILERTKESTRKRLDDELMQKIEDLKTEYAEKMEKELKLDEEDCEAANLESESDLKAKKEKKLKEVREDLEKHSGYSDARDRLAECEKALQDAQDKLLSAKKFYAGLTGQQDQRDKSRDRSRDQSRDRSRNRSEVR